MNWRKPLTLALAAAMTASLTLPALAADTPWYADAQAYVTENGLMTSTGNGFDPDATVTRATVFQTLYNAEGKPAVETPSTFTDVSGKWYADAAAWAQANGIASGTGTNTFNGDQVVTRGEIATILARYAEYKNLDTSGNGTSITGMADYSSVPSWAVDGMSLCFSNGVLSGKPGNLLAASDTATRAELATMLMNFSQLKEAKKYNFDPEHPYDGVMTGLFNNITITAGDETGTATYYLPEGMQPWTPAVIILTPNNTTAAEFAESETGLAWRAVADANKIGLAFLEPADGKTWNLTLSEDGRNDADILNQLYTTMRSKALTNVAPFSMDKSHTTLVGYGEGGAAALLFGGRYATDFSGICAVDATEVSAEALETVGDQLVYPFPGDSTMGVEEMHIQAKTVDTPVWFVNSADNNQAALDYYITANDATKGAANDYAETTYQAADSDARIWVSAKEQTPETIYNAFLGTTKRFMAMQEGGRVSFANDFTTSQWTIHEEEVNGELRRWMTYVPSSYTGDEDVPLVLVMHGYTASMYAIAEESRWYDVAEENGFIVVFAQALVRENEVNGNIPATTWVAGSFGQMFPDLDQDVDVNFINTVLDKTEAEYKIDTSRVYATGHSNGSMMTWTMGVNSTDRFAAIAPVGYMTAPSEEFSSDSLLPTWAIVGEFDSAANSEMVDGNTNVTTLEAWNEHNGVDENTLTESTQYDGKWETMTFTNDEDVPLVRFTTVLGTPHVYLQEESQTIWDEFFSKYSRGEDGTLYYEGKAVTADTYVSSDDWYTAATAE
ncbi:alpha/beta hydrolase family esterase [Flavonifractor hominis]|uniref:S-layer homology domain-containing protein n=1 Tax=Flavonifractor hominis TaxID=3133178 RepID=A0ABV1EP20_9FIRM